MLAATPFTAVVIVVSGIAALCAQRAWDFFAEHVAKTIVESHRHLLEFRADSAAWQECSSNTISFGDSVIFQSDSKVFERVGRLVEREIELLERHSEWGEFILQFFCSRVFFGVCCFVVATLIFSCGRCYGNTGGSGEVPVRSRAKGGRAIQQYGRGTLTRADGTL